MRTITRAQLDATLPAWRVRAEITGGPVIPYGAQVAVCNLWREEAAEQAREWRAAFHAPLMTARRGPPWDDTQ